VLALNFRAATGDIWIVEHIEARRIAPGGHWREAGRALQRDLLIADLKMPVMNGLKVATELRSNKRAKPMKLFTADADHVQLENAEQSSRKVISKATQVWLLPDEINRLVCA